MHNEYSQAYSANKNIEINNTSTFYNNSNNNSDIYVHIIHINMKYNKIYTVHAMYY